MLVDRILNKLAVFIPLTLLFSQALPAGGATISEQALQAWNQSVAHLQAATENSACQPDQFLWLDTQPKLKRELQAGKIAAQHAEQDDMLAVPSGLIHHWRGEVFVAGASSDDALRSLRDYEGYAETYSPAVIQSKLVGHEGNEYTYRLKFQQHGFGVTVGLLGDFRSRYFQIDARTGYTTTEATRLVELEGAGTLNEHALSLAESHGFVEKLFTVVRYRQADGGVFVEVETLSLSRDVPGAVRWMVTPLIQRFSRQVMNGTLAKLREGVKQSESDDALARR